MTQKGIGHPYIYALTINESSFGFRYLHGIRVRSITNITFDRTECRKHVGCLKH